MPSAICAAHLDLLHTPVFVLEVGADGIPRYVAFNACARDIAGRPLSDFLGKTAEDVFAGAYGRRAFARHCDAVRNAVPMTYDLDLPLGGRVRTIRTTLSPELDADGHVIRLFGSSIDISAEISAQHARLEFETLSSEMEQFVAMAAHDLRAPMRNISALAEIMRDDFADPADPRHETLDLIENVANRSMDLITEVLAHTQSTSIEKQEQVFSFPAMCHRVFDALDPEGAHRVETSLLTLKADRTAIIIVLRNLVENAIKHGNRDRLKMIVTVETGMPGMIDITLTDNGDGFSDAALDIMNGGKFKAESGYGLFAVKRLISARSGTLAARNLPDNSGAVVRFSLPGEIVGVAPSPGDDIPASAQVQTKPPDVTENRRFSA